MSVTNKWDNISFVKYIFYPQNTPRSMLQTPFTMIPPTHSLQILLQFLHAIIHTSRSSCMCAMQTSPWLCWRQSFLANRCFWSSYIKPSLCCVTQRLDSWIRKRMQKSLKWERTIQFFSLRLRLYWVQSLHLTGSFSRLQVILCNNQRQRENKAVAIKTEEVSWSNQLSSEQRVGKAKAQPAALFVSSSPITAAQQEPAQALN